VAPRKAPDEEATGSLAEGERLLRAGRLEAAIEELDGQLLSGNADPRVADLLAQAHAQLAAELRRERDLAGALEHYRKAAGYSAEQAAALAPELHQVSRTLAEEHYRAGLKVYRQDLEAAIRHWEASTTLDPDHLKARLRLLNAYKVRDKLDILEGGDRDGESP
jgi:tetratricopeptide (TPR) repeat protein